MTEDKKDLLFVSAYEGKTNVIGKEIRKNPELVTKKDMNGRLLLHWAAVGGHEELVKFLLMNNSPYDIPDDTLQTPLISACSAGHFRIAEMLIKAGANVNAQNSGGHSSLQYAASKGHVNIVNLLLRNGANVNIHDNYGATALHRAASKGLTSVVALLLNHKEIEVDKVDVCGNSPLYLACEEQRVDEIKKLVKHGADIELKNKENKSPANFLPNEAIECLRDIKVNS